MNKITTLLLTLSLVNLGFGQQNETVNGDLTVIGETKVGSNLLIGQGSNFSKYAWVYFNQLTNDLRIYGKSGTSDIGSNLELYNIVSFFTSRAFRRIYLSFGFPLK